MAKVNPAYAGTFEHIDAVKQVHLVVKLGPEGQPLIMLEHFRTIGGAQPRQRGTGQWLATGEAKVQLDGEERFVHLQYEGLDMVHMTDSLGDPLQNLSGNYKRV